MKIGLIDVDGHNFPNLALMKIAGWHKQQGDNTNGAGQGGNGGTQGGELEG